MDYDLRTRVVSLEHQSTLYSQRIGELEKWQRVSDIADARKEEQFKNMDVRFTSIDKKIESINATLSRIMWLVLGGIIMGAVGFMLNGGFAKAQERAEILLDSTRPIMPASRPLICPNDRPVLVRSYCRGPSQSPWLGEAVLRTR